MVDEKGNTPAELPAFSARIWDYVAIDRSTMTLFVTKEKRADPLLLTWLAQANQITAPKRFYVQVLQLDEIAQLRNRGFHPDQKKSLDDGDDVKFLRAGLGLIRECADLGASDVHLLLRGSYAEVQVRVKGGLVVFSRMTQEEGESLSRALFQGIATVKDSSYNPMEFQNAQISGSSMTEMGLTSVRLVRGPAFPIDEGGGFVVMRLQYIGKKSGVAKKRLERPRAPDGELALSSMGYTGWQVEALKYLARCPNGIILFTGPTGSGKTTSLFEMTKHAARERTDTRLVTIEDPVEYPMPWAVQLVVMNASDAKSTSLAFMERLRASLRMDPDTIMMGEIRDADSAIVAIDAALTGHQVWGTLHVTDPYKTISRLELMDNVRLARGVVCDPTTLRGVVAQRLVPTLCRHCSIPLEGNESLLPAAMLSALETYTDKPLHEVGIRLRGDGCDECNGDAISGRVAVAEVVVMDSIIMQDFIKNGVEIARKNHRSRDDTDKSMLGNAIDHVLQGQVDPRDVESNVDVVVPKGCEA